jgi:hypothetical protein
MKDKVEKVHLFSTLPSTSTIAISASFKYLAKPCQSMLLASMILHSFVNALTVITSPSMIFFALDSMVQIIVSLAQQASLNRE